nr:unnamed protein product [Callosobruchus analis]
MWHKKNANKNIKEDLLKVYADCNSDIFPNIKKLLQIFITLPITTATSVSSTSEGRINGLANLYINHGIRETQKKYLIK